ncbi:DNA-binding response regulator, NarL/FixJ family, contains REC and HTH domains [Dyadobacter sp. SG02]|uniref:response regulator transcription factor n=1 Tax=Dyadobacter sp. SG02 TaxID=1855291 RepID=UPI0008B62004|nr:response regulator transcription factor [Dyadobacter sp. SG02]SEJ72792.1 DNA-binding response regulator, NarL/FixJ family, contains REC and HTH domains [Dyadobacter sp. SG02]
MKIALIDSHQIFTEALRMNLLTSLPDIESIDHYSSIQAFVAEAREATPTLVITELCFNGKYDKGVDVIFRLDSEKTKIIVLTSLNDDWLIRSYMRLGAKAFLTKTCLSQELFAAVAQVQKGNLFLSEDVQKILSTGITTGAPSVEYLSSVERAILEALSRDEPFKTIANNLKISMIELKYHRRMLMERFSVKHFISLVELAKKPGILKTESTGNKHDAGLRGGKPLSRSPHKELAMRV